MVENQTAHSPLQIRVLLADDHAVVRAGIRQILQRSGDIQVVAEADDGAQAKTLIGQFQPEVAILDIQMPYVSGIDVTRWIRVHHRDIGVLILTAYDDDPYVLAVLRAGANGYVLKTASPKEIIQAVLDVYDGRSVLDPAIAHKVLSQLAIHQDPSSIESLTKRELEVLALAAKGFTNKAIGRQLGISDRTVQGHLAKSFGKLQANSRTEAVMRAVSMGWLDPELGELDEG
ncbi:MAG: response regulator transcription factor [Caldilineales bacterium]|nr:response regulator transcription factor [Caldilineales bacterium]